MMDKIEEAVMAFTENQSEETIQAVLEAMQAHFGDKYYDVLQMMYCQNTLIDWIDMYA